MFARRILLVALVAAALATVTTVGRAADIDRGRALYESNCGACHSPTAHTRSSHVAGDFEQLRGWIRRWNENLGLQWSEDDIRDVAIFLNTTYYRYPCPQDVCAVVGLNR